MSAQILLINAFKDTPASYGKLRGLQQQNSSWKFTGELAGITLPVMHSLFQAILYSVFPIIVGLVFFSERYSVLKRYFEMMVWIELWPILFAILNLIISVHSKSAGFSDITIGSIENITSTQSSYALAASSLSLMIPTFAYMIAKGGVSSFVHMAGSVMASSASGSAFAAQEVISGNRSFDNVSGNNQSFNNLHSNKVNTSGELVSGHMRQSLADGTMQTDFLHMPSASSRIFQGGIGLSSSGDMTSINIGSHIQEGLQRQVQESSSIVASESQEISRIKQQMERHAIDYLASAGESESRGEHHSWNTSTREGEMMQSAMRQMKELHDNYNYSWHQSAERVLTTNFSAGLEFNKSVGSEAAASGKKSISVEGNAGGNMQWKNSNNSGQDISENKSVSSSGRCTKLY